ncbi:MAG: class I SAM-dependent methyltransferase [Candidatus Scalindua sp.]|nr:class I SAM-dependent methyltransferase [Candidatus Scalindua sp.]
MKKSVVSHSGDIHAVSATKSSENHFLLHILVCPVCKARLEFSPDVIKCTSCKLQIQQFQKSYINLLPLQLIENEGSRWKERQQEMERWYKNLIVNPVDANNCFVYDYTPYIPLLSKLSGRILDVGGGNGIIRQFLPNEAQYIVIEPSLDWLGSEWSSLAKHFPCVKTNPCFIQGIGEYLPFLTNSFDVALSFWSLNHASQPERLIYEVHRVIRQDGLFLVVLEDMEPLWRDIISKVFMKKGILRLSGVLATKFLCSIGFRKWPVQSDHIRIRESDIHKYVSQRFEITRRAWIGQYLTFELRKTESSGSDE